VGDEFEFDHGGENGKADIAAQANPAVKLSGMARIIFVPGKNPKPEPGAHRQQLWRCLLEGVRRASPEMAARLSESPECFELVPWNYDYYKKAAPLAEDLPWIDALLNQHGPTADDIEEAQRWHKRLTALSYTIADYFPQLIGLIANDATRSTIKETHRYFTNIGGSAEIIHAHVMRTVEQAFADDEPILLIGHSLGSVIAWNALWLMTHERGLRQKVDTLLTLGSPLGMHFVQARLLGRQHLGSTRYPGCIKEWINVAAVGDLTALDATVRDDFHEMIDLGLVENISDHMGRIYNHYRDEEGLNPHHSYGYLVNPVVGQLIAEWWYGHQAKVES
jgi:hypothetical protein